MQMEQLNRILLYLQSELAQTKAEGQQHPQEYEALLSIKVKLAAKITVYCRPLEEGKDFDLGDTLDNSNSQQSMQKMITHRIVGGKVVFKVNDTKVLRY